jgi:hypothetical protein
MQYNPVQKEQYSGIRECKFCGRKHEMVKSKCPALGKIFNFCKRSNHFAAKCPRMDKKIRILEEADSSELSSKTEFISAVSRINSLGGKSSAAIYANMLIDNQPVKFQVDCGASFNTISKRLVHGKKINNGPVSLRMWNSSKVQAVGTYCLKDTNPISDWKYSIEFVVVDNDDLTPLLVCWILKLHNSPVEKPPEWVSRFVVCRKKSGKLFKGHQVVIPLTLREDMKAMSHSAHLGVDCCLRRVRLSCFWTRMASELKQYILACDIC